MSHIFVNRRTIIVKLLFSYIKKKIKNYIINFSYNVDHVYDKSHFTVFSDPSTSISSFDPLHLLNIQWQFTFPFPIECSFKWFLNKIIYLNASWHIEHSYGRPLSLGFGLPLGMSREVQRLLIFGLPLGMSREVGLASVI